MRHKVEGSGSCSGAMKEIFRKNLPPQKKLPMYSCGEKTWNEFCSPWAMIPDTFYDHQNSAWLGLAFLALKISMHISWLQRSCRFPQTPLKHSMFHSYPCFEVSHFLPNNLVQRVSTDSNSEFGEARWCFFFQVGWSRVGSVSKASPFKEMMERTMTERERLAAERYFADRVLHGFARFLLRRDFSLQLSIAIGTSTRNVDVSILIIHFNWTLKTTFLL